MLHISVFLIPVFNIINLLGQLARIFFYVESNLDLFNNFFCLCLGWMPYFKGVIQVRWSCEKMSLCFITCCEIRSFMLAVQLRLIHLLFLDYRNKYLIVKCYINNLLLVLLKFVCISKLNVFTTA